MGKNKIGIIIGREFSIRVKKRSFILTTILTPLLFAGLMLVPGLIAYYTASSQESKKVSVYDATGVVEGKLNSNDAISFSYISFEDIQNVLAVKVRRQIVNLHVPVHIIATRGHSYHAGIGI